jgi:hypothetical protein
MEIAATTRVFVLTTTMTNTIIMELPAVTGLKTSKFPHFLLGKKRVTSTMTLKLIVMDAATKISRHF